MDFDDFFVGDVGGRARKWFALAGFIVGGLIAGGLGYVLHLSVLTAIVWGAVGAFFGALLAVLFAAYIIAGLIAFVVFVAVIGYQYMTGSFG